MNTLLISKNLQKVARMHIVSSKSKAAFGEKSTTEDQVMISVLFTFLAPKHFI